MVTIKTDHAEACWEPIHRGGVGYYHDNDRWPHFDTEAKCQANIADILADNPDDGYDLVAAPCFAGPCVVIICDGCGDRFDYEGDEGMHFDPSDPMPVPITDCEWSIEERAGQPDRHYCPDCFALSCDDCGESHHDDCVTA